MNYCSIGLLKHIQKQLTEERVDFTLQFQENPSWWGGMGTRGQNRKLRVHILNYRNKAEHELEVEQGCEISKPAPK